MAYTEGNIISLMNLPHALTEHVLSNLSVGDCAACFGVSSCIRQAAVAALSRRTSWSSTEQRDVSHMKASRLFRFLAAHCPQLRRVTCCFGSDLLYGGSLLESSLTRLVNTCQQLTKLALLNVDVTDKVLFQIAGSCKGLQELALGRSENNTFGNFISDEGLAAVAEGCTALTSLALFRCYSCSDAGLLSFPRAGRQLSALVLHNCPQVSPYGMRLFAEACPQLELLDVLAADQGGNLCSCLNFETMFVIAANCQKLNVVRVSEELLRVSVLDDAALILLVRGCPLLQELELVQVEVGDALLKVIATYGKQLRRLRLEQTYVGDEGVTALVAGCRQLQELRVAGCSPHCWMLPAELMFPGITEATLPSLNKLHSCLQHLELSGLAPAPPAIPTRRRSRGTLSNRTSSSSSSPAPAGSSPPAASSSSLTTDSGTSSSTYGTVVSAVSSAINAWNRMAGSSMSRSSSGSCSSDLGADCDTALVRDQDRGCSSSHSSKQHTTARHSSFSGHGTSLPTSSCKAPLAADSAGAPALAHHLQTMQLAADVLPMLSPALATHLQGLHLDWCKMEVEALQPQLAATLACCSSLRSLSLVGYQGNMEELLAQLVGAGAPVTWLMLQHTSVSDDGIEMAAEAFKGLTSLHLSYCRCISDAALVPLRQARSLQVLDLYNVPLVSDAAMTRLVRSNPSLTTLYIGHHTGALRLSSSSGGSSSSPRSDGPIALEAVCSARSSRVQLLKRNPNTDGGFEARTLQRVLCSGV